MYFPGPKTIYAVNTLVVGEDYFVHMASFPTVFRAFIFILLQRVLSELVFSLPVTFSFLCVS